MKPTTGRASTSPSTFRGASSPFATTATVFRKILKSLERVPWDLNSSRASLVNSAETLRDRGNYEPDGLVKTVIRSETNMNAHADRALESLRSQAGPP